MSQMRILKIVVQNKHHTQITTFLLLDAQQQRVLALSLYETIPVGPMRVSAQQGATATEPLTIDFLAQVHYSSESSILGWKKLLRSCYLTSVLFKRG